MIQRRRYSPFSTASGTFPPQTRDGFVDVDRGVLESIADLKAALKQHTTLSIIASEEGADLRLYVLDRGTGSRDSGAATGINIPGPTYKLPDGNTINTPGTTIMTGGSEKGHYVATELRVGDYKRGFKAESLTRMGGGHWKRCAQDIAKDLSVWLAANRERLVRKAVQ